MRTHFAARAIIVAVAFALPRGASAQDTAAPAPVVVDIHVAVPGLSADAIRAAITSELGAAAVDAESLAAPRARGVLTVDVDAHRSITIAFRDADGRHVERRVEIRGDAESVLAAIALLAGNLARNDADEFLGAPPDAAPPSAPTIASVPVVVAPVPIVAVAVPMAIAPAASAAHSRVAPVSIGFAPFLGTNFAASGRTVSVFSLNAVGGYGYGVDGLEIGGAFNVTRAFVHGGQIAGAANVVGGEVRGAQIAGALNVVGGAVDGAQIGGAVNIAWGAVRGGQIAGAVNIAARDVRAAQIAGALNVAGGDTWGGQIAGAANLASGALVGAQIAGALNIAVGPVRGVQIAGALNVAARDLDGAQFGTINIAGGSVAVQVGVVNVARHARALQLGVINVAARSSGLAIGLLNFVAREPVRIDVGLSSLPMAMLAIRHGTRWLHNIYSVGIAPIGQDVRWTLGLGLGAHIPLGSSFVEFDAIVSHVNRGATWTNDVSLLTQARMSVGYDFARRFSAYGGIGVNALVSTHGANADIAQGPQYVYGGTDASLRIWPAMHLGLRI